MRLHQNRRKHPHVRGEDKNGTLVYDIEKETPPRAWGRPSCSTLRHRDKGNTPTCVGKTKSTGCPSHTFWKHPHVRGEDIASDIDVISGTETPPRAWGRLTYGRYGQNLLKKHPHVRGEDFRRRLLDNRALETPPRAWGRRTRSATAASPPRNTPTCVGKTNWTRYGQVNIRKHPHVRGEDLTVSSSIVVRAETPPRAWGRPASWWLLLYPFGNTPTCVGKTLRDY